MRRVRHPSRPRAFVLTPVLLTALLAPLTTLVPAPPAQAAPPALEADPPHFADSDLASPYTITVNGVELVTDATGFNHWGEQAPLFSSRTGLLVEADLVELRVVGGAEAFSVGVEIFVCGLAQDDFCGYSTSAVADAQTGDPGLAAYPDDPCVATSTTVPELEGIDFGRLGFLVGSSTAVDGVHVFTCVLRMRPGGAPPITGLNVEIGSIATFRTRATQYIVNEWFEAFGDEDPGTTTASAVGAAVAAAGCTFLAGTTATTLAADLDEGEDIAWSARIACADGRVDLADADNEVYALAVFANPRTFAPDLAAWRAVDVTARDFDPFGAAALGTLRVPLCADSAGVMPCLESVSSGWGMNLTDMTRVLPGVTLPSIELTLVRTTRDAAVGFGTVAQEGVGDRVSFALRVPQGTVRGASWANMARAAGYLFAEVVAYGIDTSPADHVVLSATLEPRPRSTALDAATFGFDCTVSVGGGASSATDCDIPAGALDIVELRMHPRAWVAASHGDPDNPGHRATKKVQGWRIDTIPGTCDDDPTDDGDTSDDCYAVPDPDGEPTVTPVYDRLVTACANTVYVDAGTALVTEGLLNAIASEDPDCDPFVEGPPPDCGPEGDLGVAFCPVATRVVHVEVRDADGQRQLSGQTGGPSVTAILTDATGAFQLFTGPAEARTPLALEISDTLAYEGCEAMCFDVVVPAIRAKLLTDADTALAVYDGTGLWTHTLVEVETPACIAASEAEGGGCLQGRRIDWLSAVDGSDDHIVPLGGTIVSVVTETANDYEVGDRLTFGGVVGGGTAATRLDGVEGLTVRAASDFAFAFSVDATRAAALRTLGDDADLHPNDCARDGTGFIEQGTLCTPDAVDLDMKPSRLVLRTSEDHGFGAVGTVLTGDDRVTTTLLGSEFDGTFEAVVVADDEVAIDGRWFATDAYRQPRDGIIVQGTSSKVVITETTLTMYLDGLPLDQAALAGGFVATNGQTFTFGEDLALGRAFDFAVAGPSRTADGASRATDGFFQAFIPAPFLDEVFGLDPDAAEELLEVNRRDAGEVGAVGFAADPSLVTGRSGLLVSSDGFSFSAPYFATERRPGTTPPASGGTSDPGYVPLPDGRTPALPQGSAVAIIGGVEVPVTATPTPGGGLVLEVGGIRLEVLPEQASQLVVDADGRRVLEVAQGGQVEVTGSGFAPGSLLYVWLFSEPELVAILPVDATGTYRGGVPLDGWASGRPIAPGGHTLQLVGTGPDGDVRALNLGVRVVTRLTPRRGPVSTVSDVTAGPGGPAPAPAPAPTPAPPATSPPSASGTTPTTPAPPAIVDASGGTDDGGGGASRTLILVGLLAAVLAAYGVVAGLRRRTR